MSYTIIPIENKDEWNDALAGTKHSFCHTWEHCYSMFLTTGYQTFLFCFEKDGVRIVNPFIEREIFGYKDLSKPFGFTGFAATEYHPEFSSAWEKFVSDNNFVSGYLGLHPLFGIDKLFDDAEVHQYNTVYVIDLEPTLDEIMKSMSSGRRKQLKKFDEISLLFSENRDLLKVFFLENYNGFLKKRGAKSFYFFSPETISYLFTLENVCAVGVFEGGKCMAATLFGFSKDMATALYHASLPGAEHYSAHLVWYGVKTLKSLGIPALNLGGGSDGIAKFKEYFGAKTFPVKCVKQIYRHDIYDKLCNHEGKSCNVNNSFFPAYRSLKVYNSTESI
ncbi:MAG: hypothetical protein JJU37_17000 [Balneolaceae bacterium]|nr:hypothetical protein [Balneolaceae bacterium]